MNPLEIVRRTPKTSHCGQCAHATCLAFAAAVARGGEGPDKCPFLDRAGLTMDPKNRPALDALPKQRDLESLVFSAERLADRLALLLEGVAADTAHGSS
jgi:CO dehydrogenase/acetyl-CoA synthase gamma subunit (corrinoid Fe-S protein)